MAETWLENSPDNSKIEKNKARVKLLGFALIAISYLTLMSACYSLNSGFNDLCKIHCEPNQYRPGWMGSSCACGKPSSIEWGINKSNENITVNLSDIFGGQIDFNSSGNGFGN